MISQLEKEGKPLVVIEKNSQELENTSNLLYITGDATDDDVLISAGIKRGDGSGVKTGRENYQQS